LILSRLFNVTDESEVPTFRHLSELLFYIYTEVLCEERGRQSCALRNFTAIKRMEIQSENMKGLKHYLTKFYK
jgi:hypothetical protein